MAHALAIVRLARRLFPMFGMSVVRARAAFAEDTLPIAREHEQRDDGDEKLGAQAAHGRDE